MLEDLDIFGIVSPQLGIKENVPSILLSKAYMSEGENVILLNGEMQRAKMRLKEFTEVLPDAVTAMTYYERPSVDSRLLIVFTKRDICYRDQSNDRYVFLNKIYNTGSIASAISLTNSFQLNFTGAGDLTALVEAGDYIQITDDSSLHTGVTWYAIESVDDSDTITCTGTLPSGFTTSDYVIRYKFDGTDTDLWSIDQENEVLVATNRGINNIITWAGSGQVTDLSCPYQCRVLYFYENRLHLGYTIETGTAHPYRWRWGGLGDITEWDDVTGSDSSYLEVDEGVGTLTAFASTFGFLTIFKERAIVKAWGVVTSEIFQKSLVINGIGSDASKSIVETEGGTAFWGNDNNFRLYNGNSWSIISDEIENTINDVNPEYSYLIQGVWIKEQNQIAWSMPYLDSQTLNKVAVYDLKQPTINKWAFLDLAVACWGEYKQETIYTWATLPFDTWATWGWDRWMIRTALSGNPLVLIGHTDGYVYRMYGAELDNEEEYTGYGVIQTDLADKQSLQEYKRLLHMQIYVRQEATGTLGIEVKRDTESAWQEAGEITLTGDDEILVKDLPVDYRAKNFGIKFTGENRWRVLGVFCYSIRDGKR